MALSEALEGRFLKIEEFFRNRRKPYGGLEDHDLFPKDITKEECLALSRFFRENKDHPRTTGQYYNLDKTAHCSIGLIVLKEGTDHHPHNITTAVSKVTGHAFKTNTTRAIIALNDAHNLSFEEQSLYWEWKSDRLDKKAAAEK